MIFAYLYLYLDLFSVYTYKFVYVHVGEHELFHPNFYLNVCYNLCVAKGIQVILPLPRDNTAIAMDQPSLSLSPS